jgi:hypothetical protein
MQMPSKSKQVKSVMCGVRNKAWQGMVLGGTCSSLSDWWVPFDWEDHRHINALFAWLISHQPAVLFSHNKPATSNQPAVLFSQNKPAPAISHQPTEQAVIFFASAHTFI